MKIKTKEELARLVIEEFLKTGRLPVIVESDLEKKLLEKKACFVTIYVSGNLRGCIGTIEADKPLYQQIIKYSLAAGFEDWRFSPLTKEELKDLMVEVSVLTPLRRYLPKNTESVLSYLKENKPGLVIKVDGRQALFLPQVWKELPDPKDFLSQLCLKAGVSADSWKKKQAEFWVFEVEEA